MRYPLPLAPPSPGLFCSTPGAEPDPNRVLEKIARLRGAARDIAARSHSERAPPALRGADRRAHNSRPSFAAAAGHSAHAINWHAPARSDCSADRIVRNGPRRRKSGRSRTPRNPGGATAAVTRSSSACWRPSVSSSWRICSALAGSLEPRSIAPSWASSRWHDLVARRQRRAGRRIGLLGKSGGAADAWRRRRRAGQSRNVGPIFFMESRAFCPLLTAGMRRRDGYQMVAGRAKGQKRKIVTVARTALGRPAGRCFAVSFSSLPANSTGCRTG